MHRRPHPRPPPFLLNASSASSRKVPTVSDSQQLLGRKSTRSSVFLPSISCLHGSLSYENLVFDVPAERREEQNAGGGRGRGRVRGGGGWLGAVRWVAAARADNPLAHDPHFLLNQSHHAAAAASDFNHAAVFEHHSRTHHRHHRVPTTNSNSKSSSHSFAPSYTHAAPAVRIQGFDVAACRGSHGSNGGGRVLSARA
ncbi:hypothetical protein ZWY2020_029498 [Hordeum vulgare]|nr:hypothetical protein ZWY2020_029498 [Hordeum vulgare]